LSHRTVNELLLCICSILIFITLSLKFSLGPLSF
jgi:hypothetical protein